MVYIPCRVRFISVLQRIGAMRKAYYKLVRLRQDYQRRVILVRTPERRPFFHRGGHRGRGDVLAERRRALGELPADVRGYEIDGHIIVGSRYDLQGVSAHHAEIIGRSQPTISACLEVGPTKLS